MKGNNKLYVCTAQMIEICQKWVDEQFKDSLEVASVEYDSTGAYEKEFVIKLVEKPTVKKFTSEWNKPL